MGSLIGIASGVRFGCRSVFSEVESVVSFQVQAASLLLFCPVFQGIFWTMPGDFVCSLGTVDGSVRPPCAFLCIWRFQSAASDPTQMMSTPVYKDQSFHSSHLPQPPVPATNRNAAFQFGLDRCRFPGLYKAALPDPSQDLTANPSRVNNLGSGLSSPSLLQPCTKPFSGRPARPQMTCPTREAGEAIRERPGVVYPRSTLRHTGRDRSRPTRSCCLRSPSPATYRRGDR